MSAILGRLSKNYKHLRKWAKKRNLDAYRLYDKDIPEYPFIVDVYGDKVIIWHRLKEIDKDEKKMGHKNELRDALKEIGFEVTHQINKERFQQKGNVQYEKIDRKNKFETINEGPLKFNVNLHDYLDTGLFLDHRPLREKLLSLEKGMKVLNLFSYTCSLGVAGAFAGATTTNVDLSGKYLQWGKENYQINNLPPEDHSFIEADILEFIKSHPESYDVIILDPPTFSNSKKMDQDWEVQKDHGWMIRKVAKCLKQDGLLFFSNNRRDFKIDLSELTNFDVEDLAGSTIPEDFRDKKIHKSYLIRKK